MSVKLRWKKYASGTESTYLDIIEGKERSYKFLGIKTFRGDKNRKVKKQQAELVRSKLEIELMNNHFGLPSDAKLNSSFIGYCDNFWTLTTKRERESTRQHLLNSRHT